MFSSEGPGNERNSAAGAEESFPETTLRRAATIMESSSSRVSCRFGGCGGGGFDDICMFCLCCAFLSVRFFQLGGNRLVGMCVFNLGQKMKVRRV